MKIRVLVISAALVALAAPAGVAARTEPVAAHVKQVASTKTPAKKESRKAPTRTSPRVLCICIVSPLTIPAMSQDDFERRVDLELISSGLEPVYRPLSE